MFRLPARSALVSTGHQRPNHKTDSPEADRIQSILVAEKEKRGRCPMIYRDDRHQRTFEEETGMRPESISRRLLAALYLLTAGGRYVSYIWTSRWPGWFCYRFLPISSSHFWLKQIVPFST